MRSLKILILVGSGLWLSTCSKTPEDKLLGEWVGKMGSTRFRLFFEPNHKIIRHIGDGVDSYQYKVDFTKTPAVLTLESDGSNMIPSYGIIEFVSANSLRVSFSNKETPINWGSSKSFILDRRK